MTPRADKLLLAGALVVWCAAIAIKLAYALPLGHDEAAFALGAQRWLAGEPCVYLARSLGTELLAMPGVALDAGVIVIRFLPAVMTLLVPLGGYLLARAAFPERRLGGLAAAVLASAHPMLFIAADVLSDLPAAGLILVGLSTLLRELCGKEATWRTSFAAGMFAAAFYVRYGSAPALASVVCVSALCYPRAFCRARFLLCLFGTGAVLAIPFIWWSLSQTGSPIGVLEISASSTRLDYIGQGIVTYVLSNPFAYYGVLVAPAVVLGLVGSLVVHERSARFLGLIAVVTMLALGLRSHAQPRYAFLFISILAVNGVGLAGAFVQTSRARSFVWTAVVVAAWTYGLRYVVRDSARGDRARDAIADLGRAIRLHSAGRPCAFRAVRTPQLAYYSGCKAANWPDAPAGNVTYIVSLPGHPADPVPHGVSLAGTKGAVMMVGI